MLQLSALVGVPLLFCVPLFRPSKSVRLQEVGLMRRVASCCKLQKNVRLSLFVWVTSLYCASTYIPMTYVVSKLSLLFSRFFQSPRTYLCSRMRQIEFAEKQLKTEPEQSGFLLTAMFVTATVSCVLVGVIAQRVHRNMFILQLIFAVGGVSSLLFPFYDSYAYLVVYMIVQGVAYSHRTLLPVIPLTEGMVSIRDNAETLALISMSQALGLFAVPIAGWMYDGMGSYTPGFVLSGCLACIVSGLLFVDVFLGRRGSDRRSTKHIDCETGVTSKASEYGVMNVVYFESYV